MELALVRRVGEDQADYHTETRKPPLLKFAQIRSGLVTREHEERMGEAIWLYLWLHNHVDRRTGTMTNYTHAAAAEDSSKGIRAVRSRFERLRREGYITAVRHQYSMDVTLTNYWPEGTSTSTLPDAQIGRSTSPEGTFNVARRDVNVPYIDLQRKQRIHRYSTNVEADAPPTKKQPAKPKIEKAPKPAAPNRPYQLFESFCQARGIDPATHPNKGQIIREASDLQKLGWTDNQVLACAKYLATDDFWQGQLRTLNSVKKHIADWHGRGEPEVFANGRPSATNGSRPTRPGRRVLTPETALAEERRLAALFGEAELD